MLADEQLLSIAAPGVVASLSPRRGEPIWSVELPDTKVNWANATTRIEGRHLALVVPETSTQAGSRVVVIDLRRGRLHAVWNLPPNTPQFTLLDDGRVQVTQ
ncbi:MAG: hypothetical protein FJ388_17895 [Verrucomicrobia bacterium]|nr:hypothetical protein [Verrucomicrobiota bacterium]